jgi:putative transposase
MSRRAREKSISLMYHVMIRGNERREIFIDDEDRFRFVETMKRYKSEKKFEMYAYCLMNNHVHILLNEKDKSISEIMKSINTSYAMYFNKKYNRIGYLFQNRFKSESIKDDSYFVNVIRYIHNNPVKAGIIRHISDYQWSSYNEYLSSKVDIKLIDTAVALNFFSHNSNDAIDKFINFNNESDNQKYLDVTEELILPKKFNTEKDIKAFISNYLNEFGLTLCELKLQKGKIKGTLKHELIKLLKTNTNLSCRDIAKLVGANKSTVHDI